MFNHAVCVNPEAGFALGLFFEVCPDVHARAVPPEEKRFIGFFGAIHEVEGLGINLFINGFHPLLGQWASVFNFSVRKTVNNTAGSEFFLKLRIFGVIRMFWFLLRIQVIEVAEKFIKAVFGR